MKSAKIPKIWNFIRGLFIWKAGVFRLCFIKCPITIIVRDITFSRA